MRRLFGRSDPQPPATDEREDRRTAIPPGGIVLYAGGGGTIVVGSNHYQAAIKKAVGRMGRNGVSVTATLVHDPKNAYDPNAISVRLDGQVIGHLQRAEAKAYRPVMDALAQRGLTAYCRCDIRPDSSPEYAYSVHVYIDTPQRQMDLIGRL